MSPIISVANLSKTYGSGFKALKNVNLDINRGEIFALLGPNGAGKTTTVQILSTLIHADAGEAALAGYDVNRQPDSTTTQVADAVHQEMAAIAGSLPAGIQVRPFYDQSNIVRESITSVRDAIIIGLALSGLIIWLFLRDWGTAMMTGLVVPMTMVVTFIAMKVVGQSFNLMTLGGLAAAVGLVIDDAIVGVENIVLHRDGGEGPLTATSSALKEITVPLIGSTLTPIVVFLPLITITGVIGTFFSALAVAMSVSLLTSLVLALGWTTNLGARLIRRGHQAQAPAAEGPAVSEPSVKEGGDAGAGSDVPVTRRVDDGPRADEIEPGLVGDDEPVRPPVLQHHIGAEGVQQELRPGIDQHR